MKNFIIFILLILLVLSFDKKSASSDAVYRREGEEVVLDWVCDYTNSLGMWIVYTENTGYGMNMSEEDFGHKCGR